MKENDGALMKVGLRILSLTFFFCLQRYLDALQCFVPQYQCSYLFLMLYASDDGLLFG
jgi:hypothetical protein